MRHRLEMTEQGVAIRILAKPGRQRAAWLAIHDEQFKIAVNEVPEKGKANQVLQQFLVTTLELRPTQVRLLSGSTSPIKRFLIRDISLAELVARIEKCLPTGPDSNDSAVTA